ncbi:DUF356 domain-containing protein [Methanobacterium sp. ACI-7]|uniref:DUF356 domain-containing protein n=1 Tax=unclassified Methanobacterium TaxID=2627676 RepID=UPI0039C1487A
MALILIRANNQEKLLNAIADIERHANLKIAGKPKLIDSKKADSIAKGILKQNLRTESNIAVIVKVIEDTTKSIMHVKKIHPPAHLVVISDEYESFGEIKQIYARAAPLKGYYSHKDTTKHFKKE